MRVCSFEDPGVLFLEPLTLTRPAFDLLCGAFSLLERQRRHFRATALAALVRPPLVDLCRLAHPDLPVNDEAWLQAGPAVLVNARWLPPAADYAGPEEPHVGLADEQVAYVLPPQVPDYAAASLAEHLDYWKRTLPQRPAGGGMMRYPWDLVTHNADVLCRDFPDGSNPGLPAQAEHVQVVGPRDRLFVAASAVLEPAVVADTRHGPVVIDREAVVQAFTRLEGPCYVGPQTWVVGANVRGSTLGPQCRIGGEVEASIVHGYSNKYHDGFLGHSYLGEWVNFGAGTHTSDLRNDYGPVSVTIAGRKIATGLTKVGSFVGDHTKTGLSTLLNTGTAVGAFANLLPSGSLLPRVIPSFCAYMHGQIVERPDLRQAFTTAATVLQRRGRTWLPVHQEFFLGLYDTTMPERRQVIRDSELRRLRRSV